MAKNSSDPSNQFFDSLSARSRLQIYSAVFCVFGAMGSIYCMSLSKPVPWYGVSFWFVYSGIVAVGWAYSFTRNIRFLFFLIPASMIAPPLLRNWFGYLPGMVPHSTYHGYLALISILSLIAGYILFISFISTEGTRTMRLQTEIGLARQIHSALVPPIEVTTAQLELYGRSDSSSEVGGDLIDMVEGQGKLGVCVADVSGHGVRAGVLMAMIKSAMRMKLLSDQALDTLLDDLNLVAFQVKQMDMFVTVSCLQFDGSNTAKYILAGHPPILHYRRADNCIEELSIGFPPIGVVARQKHGPNTVAFSSGDMFVLLTDGFIEIFDKTEEQFGVDRLKAIIAANAARPLREIYDTIVTAARAHGPQDDDQTLLLVRVL